jgi:integrase
LAKVTPYGGCLDVGLWEAKAAHEVIRAEAILRYHDLRHTAATLLLLACANPKIVRERLGHASVSITPDTYSHILPNMQAHAAREMDAVQAE